ncbi:hypothetical protein DFJ74DRAFT_682356 [Hyaloraphidium curvatum]|nr:hypothetical protein DFJ74DRAFT_682356 [Hyaloraphidium curvatum]
MAGSSVAVGTVATPTFTRSRTTSVTRTGSRTASMQSKTAPRLETFCATPRATIPDLGTALSEIWVPFGLGAISDVDVQVFWNHTYPGDVAGELTRLAPSFSPGVFDSQVKIALFDRLRESCVSLRTYSTRFDDSAPAPFTCNPAATARPAQSLSTFRGLTAVAAYWRLNLSDFEISDTGTLSSWCIYFEIPPSATSRTRSTTSAISGTSSATAKTTSSRTRTRSLTRTATATPHPFSIIRRLDSSAYDPSALTLGHDGLLYGTLSGGAPVYLGSGAYGFGSIFRLDRWGGSFARFAYFGSYNGAGSPVLDKSKAGLLHVGNGTFFGRTLSGSANNGGTLYRFRADAGAIEAVQPMWPFDGTYPPLVRARNGDIFGVSGRDQSTSDERGFVYRLSVAGVFSNLGFNLNYDASTAGNPIWVVQGCSGDDSLYGLTKSDRSIMLLFRLTPSGVFSVLHEFRDNPYNGFWPYSDGGIVSGPDCALYGTGIWRIFQYGDGSYEFLNEVVVWKYDIGSGHVSKVAIIATNVQAASVPVQLTVGWDGALYGVSQIGGANNGGFLFRVTTAGSVTILHNFRKDEAWEPRVALMQGPGGVLYGAAARYMADIALSSGTVVRQEVEWGAIFSYNLSVAGFSPP